METVNVNEGFRTCNGCGYDKSGITSVQLRKSDTKEWVTVPSVSYCEKCGMVRN